MEPDIELPTDLQMRMIMIRYDDIIKKHGSVIRLLAIHETELAVMQVCMVGLLALVITQQVQLNRERHNGNR